jgi:hypothetical protein
MGDFGEAFTNAVLAIVKRRFKSTTIATVESVDKANNVCTVIETGTNFKITNVRLLSVEDSFETQLAVYPKVGSLVSVAYLFASKNKAIVIKYSEVDEIALRGDQFGGLVKVEVLVDKLNKLEDRFNDFKAKFNAHKHLLTLTTGTGTAAIPANQIALSDLTETVKADLENEKVKHG